MPARSPFWLIPAALRMPPAAPESPAIASSRCSVDTYSSPSFSACLKASASKRCIRGVSWVPYASEPCTLAMLSRFSTTWRRIWSGSASRRSRSGRAIPPSWSRVAKSRCSTSTELWWYCSATCCAPWKISWALTVSLSNLIVILSVIGSNYLLLTVYAMETRRVPGTCHGSASRAPLLTYTEPSEYLFDHVRRDTEAENLPQCARSLIQGREHQVRRRVEAERGDPVLESFRGLGQAPGMPCVQQERQFQAFAQPYEPLQELGHSQSGHGRSLEVLRRLVRQVRLRRHDDRVLNHRQERRVFRRQTGAAVEYIKHQVSPLHRRPSPRDPDRLDLVRVFPQAGGVEEGHGNPAHVDRRLQYVARRAGNVGHDRAVASGDRVDQDRLARVRAPQDRHPQPVPKQRRRPLPLPSFGDLREGGFQACRQFERVVGPDLFAEVEARLEANDDLVQSGQCRRQRPGQRAGKLRTRRLHMGAGLRAHDFGDRFRLA